MLALRTEKGEPMPHTVWPLPRSMTRAMLLTLAAATMTLPESKSPAYAWLTNFKQSSPLKILPGAPTPPFGAQTG